MATQIAISFSTLREQLENEKSTLSKIDEHIKKIVQTSGRFNNRANGQGEQGRIGSRLGPRNSFNDSANVRKDEGHKRKPETKTVFSRLSTKADNLSDGEDSEFGPKKFKVSSTVSKEIPTRAAVLKAQGGDEQARTRNRRMFGSLLGTLQKFKQEEISLQTKEEKKLQVERKIEEQERQQKEKEKNERRSLFAERENKKAKIKALELKMARLKEFEEWEMAQKHLGKSLVTKTMPKLHWLPKVATETTDRLLEERQVEHESLVASKREELQFELQRIENRCSGRNRKTSIELKPNRESDENDTTGKKRDKFNMDADYKENDDDEDDYNHDVSMKEDKQETEPESKEQMEMDGDNIPSDKPADTTNEVDQPTNEEMDTTQDEHQESDHEQT